MGKKIDTVPQGEVQYPPILTPSDTWEGKPDEVVQPKPHDPATDPRFTWPKETPMPEYHIRRVPMPCPKCRRVLLDNSSQATICRSIFDDFAYYQCRNCKHSWKMPVKESTEVRSEKKEPKQKPTPNNDHCQNCFKDVSFKELPRKVGPVYPGVAGKKCYRCEHCGYNGSVYESTNGKYYDIPEDAMNATK